MKQFLTCSGFSSKRFWRTCLFLPVLFATSVACNAQGQSVATNGTADPVNSVVPSTALRAQSASSSYEVVRLNGGNPIIQQQMFDDLGVGDEGRNINGPSLIRIPDWISQTDRADPTAVYYLYFADHGGDYIRMAWAAEIEGPWNLYQTGARVQIGDRGVLDSGRQSINLGSRISLEYSHLASPDVHVDNENQRIIMYFHSGSSTFYKGNEQSGQYTWVSTSALGLAFYDNIEPVKIASSYFRAFSYDGEMYGFDNGAYPRQAPDGENPWEPTDGYYDGQNLSSLWKRHPDPLTQDSIDDNLGVTRAELRVRHTAVRVVGDELQLFYSRRGDSPEKIMMSTIDLSVGNWNNWELSYPPKTILTASSGWEGGQFIAEPSESSKAPEDVNQLRDPYVFEDNDGSVYLLYSGRGEDAIGIAALTAPTQDGTSNPTADTTLRDGIYADTNFGNDSSLLVSRASNSNLRRKAVMKFDLRDIGNFQTAVVRMYATNNACSTVGVYLTSNGWAESLFTWNRSDLAGSLISTTKMDSANQFYEWDVTSEARDNVGRSISFLLECDDNTANTAIFDSAEGANPPQLKLSN